MASRYNLSTIFARTDSLREKMGKRHIAQWCNKGLSRYHGHHTHERHTHSRSIRRSDALGVLSQYFIYRSSSTAQIDAYHHKRSPFGSFFSSSIRHNITGKKTAKSKRTAIFDRQQRMILTKGYHSIAGASPRQMANLEERLWSVVGANVVDPETKLHLQELGWLHRRLTVSQKVDSGDDQNNESSSSSSKSSKDSVQILLQLPTLLHPTLESLKSMVEKEARHEIDKWAADNNLSTATDDSNNGGLPFEVEIKAVAKQPIPWTVQSGQQSQDDVKSGLGPGLTNVSHFLAVYSCKGGVGKSTVAVNLAYELARLGGRVGLLDVDVYGPSLPLQVTPDDDAVRKSSLGSSMVCPIEHKGVKLLSLGYVSSNSGIPGSGKNSNASVLRGPMAGRVVTQLLKGTEWGDLDVLILDLPPGTGDVQLTVCQEINLSFAVGVTTPSKLAIADVQKGISMFNTMGIETIAMVENMAYFECEGGGKHYPFGRGFAGEGRTINDSLGNNALKPENICQLPISETANMANDTGIPICLSRPEEAKLELEGFEKLAKIVSREMFQLPHRALSSEGTVVLEGEHFDLSTINVSEDSGSIMVRFFSENGALQKRVPSQNLLRLDPMTGDAIDKTSSSSPPVDENERDHSKIYDDEDVVVSVHKASSSSACNNHAVAEVLPERIQEKGRIGFEVTWSDGSRFIYRRSVIAIAAGGTLVERK
uniref:Gamma-butyrobetaine hydroxylase-like N-terminal domain-containing protein n=1 Tax=Pseudo-nitzschia australis TaxID=44445 RepID=A0A6V0B2R3_9STRA|mmetsp:Transcript_3060/g.6592  ORF Transcript_3060/g.6592 Transcript_3060/m.6592 type:complete len:708 (+) Transcript_3060:44-2167(+)